MNVLLFHRRARQLALGLLPLAAFPGPVSAAPLFWGGGSTSLTDGTALTPGNGAWAPGTIGNWAADNGPAYDYTAWTNGSTAVFGAGNAGYTVAIPAAVTVDGITTAVFSGTGAGGITLQGDGAIAQVFTITSGGIVNVAAGTTLQLLSNSVNALSIVTSGFVKDGGGTFIVDSTTVGNTNTAGVVEVRDGILRVLGDRAGIFSNESLSLTGASSVLETGQGSSSVNGLTGLQFSGFNGVAGSRIRSTGSGTSYVTWSSSTDGNNGAVLLADGGTDSRLGLVKSGSGTFTLNGSQSYTGGTLVNAGRLIAGSGGAVTGSVSVRNTGTFEAAAAPPDGQPSGITVQNSGRLVANAAIDLRRVKVLGGAAVEFAGASGISGTGRTLTTAPGGFLVSSQPLDNAFLNRVAADFAGTVALGTDSSASLDFSSLSGGILPGARLGVWGGSFSYSGTLTPQDGIYRLGGTNAAANVLTLAGSNALTGTRSLEIGVGPAGSRLGDPANSTVSLQGSNDLSGSVSIGKFSTLELAGSSGALTAASALTLNSGSLVLRDDAVLGANSNRVPAIPITVNQGGSITLVTGTRGNTEDIGTLIPVSGESSVSTSGTGLGTTGTAILRLASLGTRGSTATVRFSNGTSQSVRFVAAAAPVLTNGLVGGWSVTGTASSNFTTLNSGNIPAQSAPAAIASDAAWTAAVNTGNYTIDGNFTAATEGNRSVYALRIGSTAASVVDLGTASNLITIESGGLLLSNNNAGTLQGGTLTAGAGSVHHLFIHASAPADTAIKTLGSVIADNGSNPVTVVKAGPGLLALTSANSHSGGTVINAGNLRIASATDVPVLGSGPLVFDGNDTTLSIATGTGFTNTRTIVNNVTVNADSTFSVPAGAGVTTAFAGSLQLNNEAVFTVSGNIDVFSGPVSGSGAVRFVQGSSHTFSGSAANTYSGPTVVGSGTLHLGKTGGVAAIAGDLYLGEADAAFAEEIVNLTQDHQIADTSRIYFAGGTENNAGILRLNGNRLETVAGLYSVAGNGIVENGGAAGTLSVLTVRTVEDSSFGGVLRNNAAGEADRALSLIKQGAGTLTLEGSSTHTGPTVVESGTLRVNGSLNQSALTIQGGAVLSGNGLITTGNQPVIFQSGSSLVPGNSPGTLTFDTGSSFLDIGAAVASTAVPVLQFELGPVASSDSVSLLQGTLAIGDGLLEWDDLGFTLLPGFGAGSYTLFSTTGPVSGTLGPDLSGPLGGFTGTLSLGGGGSGVVLTVVPEPGAAGLVLSGLLVLGMRRRRVPGGGA